jgi:DNA-binding NarL/FixJ family response regulator
VGCSTLVLPLSDVSEGAIMRLIRVVVADDDAAFREALVDVLGADPRFTVVEALSTGVGIGAVVERSRPDLVILDVRMPGGGAIAARHVRRIRVKPPAVVALSTQTSTHTVVEVLLAGAVGYLVKGRVGAQLPDLLARCAAGEVVLAVPTGAEVLRQLRGLCGD